MFRDGSVYTLDAAGNRTAKQNLLNGITESYTYDLIYQLTQAAQGSNVTESYTYDAVGNRLTSLTVPSLTYDSSNELLSTSRSSYGYDYNGNLTSKTNSSGTVTYVWDYENRLTSVTLPAGGGTVTFKYDPFGRRIQKSGPAGTTNYLYDGANIVTDLDVNGAVLARYTQGAGIDEPLASLTALGTAFFEADGLGSITSLSGITGLTDTYTYKPFGITSATGSNPNRFRFTGREFDQETNLYYYRARYYDPNIGRFISEDPIQFRGGNNFYSYVSNWPTKLIDPFGTQEGENIYGPVNVDNSNPAVAIASRTPTRLRSPDYYQCQCGVSLKCLKGKAGPSFAVEVDYYGNVYAGAGPTGGTSTTKVSCSCTANWVGSPWGPRPLQPDMQNFLTGPSYSVTAGWGLVGQASFANGTGGPGIGVGTPQAGGGYTYSLQLQYFPKGSVGGGGGNTF